MWHFSKIELKQGISLGDLAKAIPQNEYAAHKAIWKLFDSKNRDFLYRREELGHWPCFYTLSQQEPTDRDGVWQIQSRPFTPQLAADQRLAFSLRVNPVVTRKLSDDLKKAKHRRDDVVADLKTRVYPDENKRPPQAQLIEQAGREWLEQRAAKYGFSIESARADNYRQQRFFKSGQKTPVVISTLDYDGILRISDADIFLARLYQGIGPARGFGCGLMLLRRV